MKKYFFLLMALFIALMPQYSFAQKDEIAQLLLNVEKLSQFKSILKQMKQGYKILDGGYNTVKDISQGNFNLHKTFLDGLMAVSPAVKKYRKIAQIIDGQITLVKEYKSALGKFRSDKNFNINELEHMERIYGNLLDLSLRNLDELASVVTAGKMRMSDDERLKAIDRIYEDMEDKIHFLRHFNEEASILSLQRSKAKKDIRFSEQINGIKY